MNGRALPCMDADASDISMGPVLSRVVEANLVEAGAFFEGKGAVGIHE